jgi:hypothetical protein
MKRVNEAKEKMSIPRKLQYKMGNSQSIRVGSRYIHINTRAQYVVIIVIITLGFLTLSHLAWRRLAPSSSIRMYEDGSSGGMGRAG